MKESPDHHSATRSARLTDGVGKMRAALVSVVLLFAFGCSSPSRVSTLPKQAPLFSLTVTQGAFSGPVTQTTGWLFFVEDSAPIKGPFLSGYRLVHGEVREILSRGSASAEVVAAIEAIDLEPFDWKTEVEAANARFVKSFEGKDEGMTAPMTLDGAEWELTIITKHGRFSMREWNPGPQIDFYAAHSEKISKLKRVIDTLALYEGRTKLGI
jgi:hypothetical protein